MKESNGSFKGLLKIVKEDWYANGASWFKPGFHAMAVHRFGAWQLHLPGLFRALLEPAYQTSYILVRNFYGIELPRETSVGRRVRLSHQSGIVIHPDARIGDDCVIRQNVTIGATNREHWMYAPSLGNGVEVGAGAVIIGKVQIGDNARIGPNTVVMTNIPAESIVVAPPPRVIAAKKLATLPENEQSDSANEKEVTYVAL